MKRLISLLLMLMLLAIPSLAEETNDFVGVYETVKMIETYNGVTTEYNLGDMRDGKIMTAEDMVFELRPDGTFEMVVLGGVHIGTGTWKIEDENIVITRSDPTGEIDGIIIFNADGTVIRIGDRVMDDGSVMEMVGTMRKRNPEDL